MWPTNYHDRLSAWIDLRSSCRHQPLDQALLAVQTWWLSTPWQPYYLHWDDRDRWPNPWELLSDNIFCDVARALGMLYTVTLLDRIDCQSVELISTDQDNLVLVQGGKYVMNWQDGAIVNIASKPITIHKTLEPVILARLLG